jgi:DNA-binding PucR family transcriptional regulator
VVEARLDLLSEAGLATDTAILVGVARTLAAPTGIPLMSEAAHASSVALATEVSGLVVVRQDEVVGVFPAEPLGEKNVVSRIERLVSSLGARGLPLTVGVSTVRHGLAAVPEAYREATVARETLGDRAGVRSLSALSTLDYLVMRPDESARQLIRPEVRAFIEEDLAADHVFVDTLLRYVDGDMNAKAAAAALHVHANTVYYRLERITERTGCDLRRVAEVIELLLAVRLLTAQ